MSTKTIKVSATYAFDYLDKIVEVGGDFHLKSFCNLPSQKREEIICETFSRKYAKLLSMNLPGFNVNRKSSTITVSKEVSFFIKAINNTRRKRINLTVLTLSSPHIEVKDWDDSIVYAISIDRGVIRSTIDRLKSSNQNAFSVYLDSDDKVIVKDLWNSFEEKLPHSLHYEENDSKFLFDFFDTLTHHRIQSITGFDVGNLRHIYQRACNVLPDFANLPVKTRVKLLDKAYTDGMATVSPSKDINYFAKHFYRQIEDHKLYTHILVDDFDYTAIQESKRKPDGIYSEKFVLKVIFYRYERSGKVLCKSFTPYDIWHILAGTAYSRPTLTLEELLGDDIA